MRKRLAAVIMLVLVLCSIHCTEGAKTTRVLVDESRVQTLLDAVLSFENTKDSAGFGNAAQRIRTLGSLEIKKSGTLTYAELSKYDVLIIASCREEYSSSEAAAVKKFVENGGGLLFMSDFIFSGDIANSISKSFNVSFDAPFFAMIVDNKARKFSSSNFQFYVTEITSHPITEGVEKIALNGAVPISTHRSGTVLVRTSENSWLEEIEKTEGKKDSDEKSGPFDVLLAIENRGKGRAVFFGCASSFFNWVTEEPNQQNLKLLEDTVKWLGERGGPYKQYKPLNEQAQREMSDAKFLYSQHKFSQAKMVFKGIIDTFEKSIGIYPNSEAESGISEAESYISKCEIGIEADQLFESALSLLNSKEYEEAAEEFKKAKPLYETIEYTERAQECTVRIEAILLFQQGEEALSKAPSFLSATGYEEAKSLFEQSEEKWEGYNDNTQVAACEEKISQCNEEIAKIERNRILLMAGVAAAVMSVLVVVIVISRKGKGKREMVCAHCGKKLLPDSKFCSHCGHEI
jgi:tetratricopeptide (TPR) repeat protein